jgi:nitrile hydratase
VNQESAATLWLRPHLRTPGYIFGKHGVVERCCGAFPSPELLAFGICGSAPAELYRVRFVQKELWPGYEGGGNDTIDVELYEPWLLVPPERKDDSGGPPVAKRARSDNGKTASSEAAATATATTTAAAAVAAASAPSHSHHDHGHNHHGGDEGHGHDHEHEHEARAAVEQTAVDREAAAGPYRRVAEALKGVLMDAGLLSAEDVSNEIERQDMNEHSCAAGSRLVVHAWRDPEFKQKLLEDGKKAVREFLGLELDCEQLVVVANSSSSSSSSSNDGAPADGGPAGDGGGSGSAKSVHHLVVCTLCSCYPTALLGKPPDWYKSRSYRARAVFEPRKVLEEFGLALPPSTALRVHDSTADMRYLVLPEPPNGASVEADSEAALLALVTRDSMVGAGLTRKHVALVE